jgi:hypothetical protein
MLNLFEAIADYYGQACTQILSDRLTSTHHELMVL